MAQETTASSPQRVAGDASASRWGPFRHPVYRRLWIATVVANIGAWMYNAAAGWLMTSLNPAPLMVSLVQVATMLPMFLFALPAGALADIIDKRRFILVLEILSVVTAGLFALLVSLDLVTPAALLAFMFVIGTIAAIEAPAWQSVVPQLVPRQDLTSAIAANSVGINISRAVGPALAGVLIGMVGIAAPFWVDAISNFGVIGVFLWWRSRPASGHALPAERVIGAIRVGFRHVRNNYHLRCTLRRAAAFFMFASAYWALLPLVARGQIGGGPELYGILLGAIGLGAVGGAVVLARLKGKVGANRMVTAGQIGTAIALALFGAAREPVVAVAASLMAGMCWIAVLANLNVSAQTALPDWVRGRGLAMYVTVFFGTMTVSSAAWGWLAGIAGLPATHFAAAAGALLVLPLTARWKLQTAAGIDLSPSMHWPAPVVSQALENDSGPVMVTVEYRVEPPDRDAFLRAIEKVAAERRRDGAYAWEMFQDTADPTHFVETFFFESWLEHLRQHERVTNADRLLENHVRKYSQAAPVVTHFVAARPDNDEVSR